MIVDQYWRLHTEMLGNYIRAQRRLAQLSLRELATRTRISDPYLGQLERGRHLPSVKILCSLALALNVSPEAVLAQAGLLEPVAGGREANVDSAISADPSLGEGQKQALLAVYRTYLPPTPETACP